MQTISYYLGLALLFTHEIDAVRAAEWRLLYVLRTMADSQAYAWFVGLHVPLFFLMLWLSQHKNAHIQQSTRVSIALFLLFHGANHWRLSSDPAYGFSGLLSNSLLIGSSLCGLIFVVLVGRQLLQQRRL